jgi:aspartyl-tRNA(Asn)/glutamyl-tRNA(Gln) amidotransferase subunit A
MTATAQRGVAPAAPGAGLADLSVAELGAGFRSGLFSPVDVLEAVFARIDAFDASINAFVFQDRAASRSVAEASAARHAARSPLGPLDGVAVSIKDLTPVAGWPNRRGSRALASAGPAVEDAPAVARLREAGCVLIGKTATSEHGSRIVTRSALHGVTRNPWALDRTPGGSSGGAAAAVALGMGTIATGSDGAGSIRIPAAFCNVTGLKPSFGRVPAWPPSHFMPHAVVGPLARRIDDLAAAMAVMAQPDPRDPFAWPVAFETRPAPVEIGGLRVAVSADLGVGRAPDPEVTAALERVAAALSDAGAIVEAASPHWPVPPAKPFAVFWTTGYAAYLDLFPPEQAALMSPLIHELAAKGRAVDILSYHRAVNERLAITATAHAFLTRHDAILCPSVIGPAFDIEREAPATEQADDWAWCPYAYVFNLAGQPALAIPAGFDSSGLPIGVQLAARVGREEVLFRLGRAVEHRFRLFELRPPMLDRSALADRAGGE